MGSDNMQSQVNTAGPSTEEISLGGRIKHYLKAFGYNAIPLFVLLIIWQLLASTEIVHKALFPPMTKIFATALEQIRLGNFFVDVGYSLARIFFAGSLAIILGTVLGLLLGFIKPLEKAIIPVMQFFISIPGVAVFPIAVLWFGLTETALAVVLVAEAGVTVAFNAWTGVKQVPGALVNAARSMGEKGLKMYLRILVPAALPTIVTGYRLGIARGWRVLVAGEMVTGIGIGLGYRVYEAQEFFASSLMFSSVMTIAICGLLIERIFFRGIELFTLEKWGTLR